MHALRIGATGVAGKFIFGSHHSKANASKPVLQSRLAVATMPMLVTVEPAVASSAVEVLLALYIGQQTLLYA